MLASDSDSEAEASFARAVAFNDEAVLPVFEMNWSMVALLRNRRRRRRGRDVHMVVVITGALLLLTTVKLI